MGSNSAAQRRRVLVVDDSDDDVDLLCRAVGQTKVPWTITAVLNNGEEAIRHLEKLSHPKCQSPVPELLLLDLNMPRRSGFDVLDWIEKHLPECLKTVVLSSSPQPADIKRARELGATHYLVKPSTFDELLRLVLELERSLQVA